MTVVVENPELVEFKKLVVKKAMASAKKYDWCEVVAKTLLSMGLENYLPTLFSVEKKDASGTNWFHYEEADTQKEAVSFAKSFRRESLSYQKEIHEREYQLPSERLYVAVGRGVNLDDVLAEVKERHEVVVAGVKNMPKFEAPEYPKFRAVERSARGKLIRVVETVG